MGEGAHLVPVHWGMVPDLGIGQEEALQFTETDYIQGLLEEEHQEQSKKIQISPSIYLLQLDKK